MNQGVEPVLSLGKILIIKTKKVQGKYIKTINKSKSHPKANESNEFDDNEY